MKVQEGESERENNSIYLLVNKDVDSDCSQSNHTIVIKSGPFINNSCYLRMCVCWQLKSFLYLALVTFKPP